jgi:hypothetical protein
MGLWLLPMFMVTVLSISYLDCLDFSMGTSYDHVSSNLSVGSCCDGNIDEEAGSAAHCSMPCAVISDQADDSKQFAAAVDEYKASPDARSEQYYLFVQYIAKVHPRNLAASHKSNLPEKNRILLI